MLIRNATAIMTGRSGHGSELARAEGGDLRIDAAGRIAAIGRLQPEPGERVLDATDCVIYPGWVNTHHHLIQSLQKGVPAGINLPLLGWLDAVPYKLRGKFDAELLSLAAEIGMVELMLSGCTTIADHHYVYWPGMGYDPAQVLFDMAQRLGVRFVLCRGGATQQRAFELEDPNALPPETLEGIIQDVERLVHRYHDAGAESMRRIVLAPSTPNWSLHVDELRPTAAAARRLGIRLHKPAPARRIARPRTVAWAVAWRRRRHWRGPVRRCRSVSMARPRMRRPIRSQRCIPVGTPTARWVVPMRSRSRMCSTGAHRVGRGCWALTTSAASNAVARPTWRCMRWISRAMPDCMIRPSVLWPAVGGRACAG